MKRVVACVAFVLLLAGSAFCQSLGDVARQNRIAKLANKKTAAHVYTNDDIPSVTVPREAAPPSPAKPDDSAPLEQKSEAKPSDSDTKISEAVKKTEVDQQSKKLNDSYKTKIDEARKNIDLLQRELEVAQREHQIQAAVYYADAGTRLRDPKDWTEKQKKYQEETAEKAKALEDAKAKLAALEEEARRAGQSNDTSEASRTQ
jgi:hypothetical protein